MKNSIIKMFAKGLYPLIVIFLLAGCQTDTVTWRGAEVDSFHDVIEIVAKLKSYPEIEIAEIENFKSDYVGISYTGQDGAINASLLFHVNNSTGSPRRYYDQWLLSCTPISKKSFDATLAVMERIEKDMIEEFGYTELKGKVRVFIDEKKIVTLSENEIAKITSIPKGARPSPTEYLSSKFIDSHLSQFNAGVTKISSNSPRDVIGPPQGTFVMPTTIAEKAILQAGGDIAKLEQLLGLEKGALGTSPVRIDIPFPKNIRMPSGNEPGANSNWMPGGKTNAGVPEAIIDQVLPGQYTVRPLSENTK